MTRLNERRRTPHMAVTRRGEEKVITPLRQWRGKEKKYSPDREGETSTHSGDSREKNDHDDVG